MDGRVAVAASLLITVFLGSCYYAGSTPMNWPTRMFPVLPLLLLCVLPPFYISYRLSSAFESFASFSKVMQWIGRHSLTILIWHFVGFRICSALLVLGESNLFQFYNHCFRPSTVPLRGLFTAVFPYCFVVVLLLCQTS